MKRVTVILTLSPDKVSNNNNYYNYIIWDVFQKFRLQFTHHDIRKITLLYENRFEYFKNVLFFRNLHSSPPSKILLANRCVDTRTIIIILLGILER